MNSDINIVFAANYNYAPHVLTTIKSVCYHNKGVNFYLLHCGFPREWVRNVNRHLEKYDSQLQSLTVNDDLFKGYPSLKHISSESTYYRFLISEAVNADRALYLDCDLVVTGNLREFYYTDFNNNLAIAIPDICLDVLNWHHPYNLHLGKYVNSGVLLVDCKAWREQKIQNKLFDTANQYVSKVPYGDQCILNMVLKDKISFADAKYNYQVGALRELKLNEVEHKMPKLPETQLPYIIHYTSTEKPWHRDKSMMHRDKYWFYHNLEWCEISEKWEK
ncbi:glycosyltransferase family 8 protein [Ursidibacter arcticus]